MLLNYTSSCGVGRGTSLISPYLVGYKQTELARSGTPLAAFWRYLARDPSRHRGFPNRFQVPMYS